MNKKLYSLLTISAVCFVFLVSSADAQIDLGIGIRGGLSSFDDPIGSGPQIGGHLRLKASPKMVFEGMAEVFTSSWDENQLQVSWRNILIGITGSYQFSLPTKTVTPYLGAGMCFHRITKEFASVVTAATPSPKETSSEGCFHVLGGLRINLPSSPISFFAEGRYMAVGDEETPNFPSLIGGITLTILR